VLRALKNSRRPSAPDVTPSTSAPGTTAPTNMPARPPAAGRRSESTDGAPGSDNYSRQLSRKVSSAFLGIALRDPNQPEPVPVSNPPLGIFSDKPMPQWATPLPLSDLFGNSNPSGDSDLFNLLAGISPRNTTQPELPQQTAASQPVRHLGRRVINPSPAPAYDPGVSAARFAPSSDQEFSGGLLGRLAAFAGIAPQNPTLPAQAPEYDEQEQPDRFASA
jgi:hypothetical protein